MDLDAAQIVPPVGVTMGDLPPLPEPEAKVLKNHLKQVLDKKPISRRNFYCPCMQKQKGEQNQGFVLSLGVAATV